MKILNSSQVDQLINLLIDKEYECINLNEGCLTSGDWICIPPNNNYYIYEIKEKCINEWNSCQIIRRTRKLSKRQKSLIDKHYNNEINIE